MKLNKSTLVNLVLVAIAFAIWFTPLGGIVRNKIHSVLNPAKIESEENKEGENDSTYSLDLPLKGLSHAKDVNLADLSGEVVFLNFWGTWCPPCRAEMPSIQRLYEEYGDKVKFILITLPSAGEPLDHVSDFAKENEYTMPMYEAVELIPEHLYPEVVPTTFVLDKKGNVMINHQGGYEWDSKRIKELLDGLIAAE